MRIYLDSVILIYFLDHVGPFQIRAAKRLAAMQAAGDEAAVSDLVRLECRVDPVRKRDKARLAAFDGFFAHPDVAIIPIGAAIFDRATEIRAMHGYKTIDAINLAAAVEGGCGSFLTNDARLSKFPSLSVEILS
ncbi:MAG: type II toxin-antitoxin system VapC family toxin [Planctomycetes bacterium]|nr:type II toxin-antitoxin system VapC family toxin [Planctomycetota bacterium]